MNKIRYIRKRFQDMLQLYIGNDVCLYMKCLYFLDWLFAFLIQGASVSDYFGYGFYKKRINGRNEYITYRRFCKIQNICNKIEDRDLCRNKIKFNKYFFDFLGRKSLDVNNSSFEDFKSFFERNREVFVKEISSYRGKGVKMYSFDNIDILQLYTNLKSEKNNHYILEEKIVQAEALAEFHPWSINTIRIVTLYDNIEDIVYFMSARLRMGNKQNVVDNFHYEGIGANVDIETGIIDSVGYNVRNEFFFNHPITGKQIIGFKIPYWQECKEFVMKAARHIPTVRYVGWDIVLLEGGKFLLIEGNDNADHDFQQLHYRGLWKEYKKMLKQLRRDV